MASRQVLQCNNLTKRFGSLVAIDDLAFSVNEGEIFGVAGSNGAGKTTLFNVISGHLKLDIGKIIFQEKDITRLPPHVTCRLGIARTFQIPTTFSSQSVLRNALVGSLFGASDSPTLVWKLDQEAKDRAIKALDFVGLADRADALASALPLYDQKALMLASALATQPRLLLLDEPTSGLMPEEIKRIMALIRKINEDTGITIILIEHVMMTLMGLSNRIMVLNYGEKISEGTPSEVSKDRKVIEVYLGEEYV
jgi:branched-chain amino acid transport system ATP-binding protein